MTSRAQRGFQVAQEFLGPFPQVMIQDSPFDLPGRAILHLHDARPVLKHRCVVQSNRPPLVRRDAEDLSRLVGGDNLDTGSERFASVGGVHSDPYPLVFNDAWHRDVAMIRVG